MSGKMNLSQVRGQNCWVCSWGWEDRGWRRLARGCTFLNCQQGDLTDVWRGLEKRDCPKVTQQASPDSWGLASSRKPLGASIPQCTLICRTQSRQVTLSHN